MMGMLLWKSPEAGKREKRMALTERSVLHMRFACVEVVRGPKTPSAVLRRRVASAAKKLHRAGVTRAVLEAMTSFGNPGRGVHEPALAASRAIYDARCALARLFHAENPARIAFTANATQALNTAIKGILNPGDHVITTAIIT